MKEYCIQCGNKLKKDDKFCDKCGYPVETIEEVKEKINAKKEEGNKMALRSFLIFSVLFPLIFILIIMEPDCSNTDEIVLGIGTPLSFCYGLRGLISSSFVQKNELFKGLINCIVLPGFILIGLFELLILFIYTIIETGFSYVLIFILVLAIIADVKSRKKNKIVV